MTNKWKLSCQGRVCRLHLFICLSVHTFINSFIHSFIHLTYLYCHFVHFITKYYCSVNVIFSYTLNSLVSKVFALLYWLTLLGTFRSMLKMYKLKKVKQYWLWNNYILFEKFNFFKLVEGLQIRLNKYSQNQIVL